jgi:uncharacterized YccA/Bax inhibitor family protein
MRHLTSPLRKPRWPRLLAWGLLVALTVGVVWLYQRPEMLIMLSDQLWACF